MADKPAAEKTEEPTAKRLNKTREKGQVAQSQEVGSAVAIVVLVLILAATSKDLVVWLSLQVEAGMSGERGVFLNTDTFLEFINRQTSNMLWAVLPLMVPLFMAGILGSIMVGGATVAPKALMPKWSEVNPITGFGRLVNMKSFVKLGISIIKLIVITLVVITYLKSRDEELIAIRWAWSSELLSAIGQLVFGLLVRVTVVLLVIAALDVGFQKWKYMDDLKMTKQEVKEEHKETEGSPEVRARARRVRIEMARSRSLQEVPKANVLLVNPTHVAVALRYDSTTMDAPTVVAKGADHMAAKIREIARAHGVPILRRPPLARAIYKAVEPGQPVPESLYAAVAEVLALIYRLRRRGM
ncbi:MAG: flagellar biosynthesis protein FlhB [Phycisphaeraceae bacterium]|nr:flagellar biosynthesis protein FlhB [Phycisphaeraceae bacterium]